MSFVANRLLYGTTPFSLTLKLGSVGGEVVFDVDWNTFNSTPHQLEALQTLCHNEGEYVFKRLLKVFQDKIAEVRIDHAIFFFFVLLFLCLTLITSTQQEKDQAGKEQAKKLLHEHVGEIILRNSPADSGNAGASSKVECPVKYSLREVLCIESLLLYIVTTVVAVIVMDVAVAAAVTYCCSLVCYFFSLLLVQKPSSLLYQRRTTLSCTMEYLREERADVCHTACCIRRLVPSLVSTMT